MIALPIRVLLAAAPDVRAAAEARIAADGVEVLAAIPLGDPPPDVILVDAEGWHATLSHLRAGFPSATRVVLAGAEGPSLDEVARDGVHDVIAPDEPARALARSLRLGAERARLERKLRDLKRRYRDAVHSGGVGTVAWHLGTRQMRFDPGWKAMLGYADDEHGDDPQSWFSRVHSEDRAALKAEIKGLIDGRTRASAIEYRLRHRGGQFVWAALSMRLEPTDDDAWALVGEQRDVTVERVAEEKLAWVDKHDSLTGLLGRQAFVDAVDARIATQGQIGALGVCDIDGLKAINLTHGRSAGDEVLVWLSGLLEDRLGERRLTARLTGDKLGFLLPGQDFETAAALVEQMRAELDAEVFLSPAGAEFTASATFAVAEQPRGGAAAWLATVDQGLDEARERGGAVLILPADDSPMRITMPVSLSELRASVQEPPPDQPSEP